MTTSDPRLSPVALALVVLALGLLAGCLVGDAPTASSDPGDGSTAPPEGGEPAEGNLTPSPQAGWWQRAGTPVAVHGPNASQRPAEAYPGSLPVIERRPVPALAFEPTLGLDDEGRIFYAAIGSTPDPRPLVLRSEDMGNTWTDVTPAIGPAPTHPVTNDPFLHVDTPTGRVFQVDMHIPGPCTEVSWTGDRGQTWTTVPVACPTPFTDHPNLFTGAPPSGEVTVGYPRLVYLCGSDNAREDLDRAGVDHAFRCTVSRDGGTTWGPPREVFKDGGCKEGANAGHGTTGPNGTVYVPHVTCDVVVLHISDDGGASWTRSVVDETLGSRGEYNHEARVATDEAGNVYVFWIAGDGRPHLSLSPDRGGTWSDPIPIAPPGIQDARFPAIAAGDEGRIAVQYLASAGNQTWHAYVGISQNATGEAPTFATVRVTAGNPVSESGCEDRCGGVGDFLDVDATPKSGQVVGALSFPCPSGCGEDRTTLFGPYGRGEVVVQTGGAGLDAG